MPRRLTTVLLGTVAYAYVGYPLLVSGMARFRRPPLVPTDGFTPHVTVIVSALDEDSVIDGKLRNILSADYPRSLLDVVVVADGSQDGTETRASRVGDERITVLHDPVRRGKAAAMMRGVAAARGEILVFTDANNTCLPSAIRQIVAPFVDATVGGVSGAKTVRGGGTAATGERLYWAYESAIRRAESRLGFCASAIGELVAVRAGLVPQFPDGLVNDDFYLAMHIARAGYRMVYAAEAVSVEPPAGAAEEMARRRRIAAGRWQALAWWRITLPVNRPLVLWEVASHKYLRLLLPFAMAGAFATTAIDAARGRRGAQVLLTAHVVAYGLGIAAPVLRRPRALRVLAAGARYVLTSNLAVGVGLRDYVVNRHGLHMWERARHTTLVANPARIRVTETEGAR